MDAFDPRQIFQLLMMGAAMTTGAVAMLAICRRYYGLRLRGLRAELGRQRASLAATNELLAQAQHQVDFLLRERPPVRLQPEATPGVVVREFGPMPEAA